MSLGSERGGAGNVPTAQMGSKATGAGLCPEDVWGGGVCSFVQSKVPTLTNVVYRSRAATAFTQENERATAGSGSATQDTTRNGGVIRLATGITPGSRANFRNRDALAAAGVKVDYVSNIRTQKCALAVRYQIIGINVTGLMLIGDVTDTATSDVYFGMRGATSTSELVIQVGAVILNTTVPIAAGVWKTGILILDGTNVKLWDFDTGALVGSVPQVNAATTPGHFRSDVLNQGTGTNVEHLVDDAIFITEPAA